MNKKFISLLSLAQKAGFIVTGEEQCEKAISSGKGKLIILATDASDNTKKKFRNKSIYYKVPIRILSDRDTLSKAIGKNNRPTLVIIDDRFATQLSNLIDSIN